MLGIFGPARNRAQAEVHVYVLICQKVPEASQKRCRSSGDPHYTSWNDKQFDFMGIGTYRLAAAPLTRCGCDMDVQTFTAPSDLLSKGGSNTGSSNVALAARFGTVLITILGSDRSIHIHDTSTDPPTDVPMTWDEWGSSDQKDALVDALKPADAKRNVTLG